MQTRSPWRYRQSKIVNPFSQGETLRERVQQSLMGETPCSRAASPKSKIELLNAQFPSSHKYS
ncbi:MAG: hypothetical protein V7L04_29315 [Nostoc sp.]|uniref:hypothetical protein n=1 Tax=Nostoc sp. TaxID=1180 RepID=UPI002FF85966